MVFALVVVGIIAIGLVIAVVLLRGRAAATKVELAAAEELAKKAEERAQEAEGLVKKAEADAQASELARTAAQAQATQLSDEVRTAEEARAAAEQATADAASQVEAAVTEVEEARRAGERLVESAAIRADSGGLWFLEAVRVERRWRSTVVGSTDVSLFEGDEEPARLALAAVIDAIREESGTTFELSWQLTEVVPPPLAFSLVRAGEELLSAITITSDGGVLEVTPEPGAVILALRAEPEPDLSAELLAVFDVLGWEVGGDHGTPRAVTVRIPLGAPTAWP